MIKKILAAMLALFAAVAFAAVDANKATQAELEAVKGIGPALATKILDERKKGDFKDWQDMVVRVKGVGERNAAKFSTDGLTVNGAAFSGAPAKTDNAPSSKPAQAPKSSPSPAASTAASKGADNTPSAKPAQAPKNSATAPVNAAPSKAADTMPSSAPAQAPQSASAVSAANEKRAAAAKAREEKKAAKKAAKEAAKEAKPAAAAAASAPASAAKK